MLAGSPEADPCHVGVSFCTQVRVPGTTPGTFPVQIPVRVVIYTGVPKVALLDF